MMQTKRKINPQKLFFPAASIHATVMIPASVWVMTGQTAWPPGLIGAEHGYEMLFGFALALVTGYLAGPVSRVYLSGLFVLWLSGRLLHIAFPDSAASMFSNALFAVVLALRVAPRFKSAKKWRNRAVVPLLLAIFLFPLLWTAQNFLPVISGRQLFPAVPVLLFSMLMAFIGGRIIAPAAAGEFYRQGANLAARVQPRIEGGIILALAGAVLVQVITGSFMATGVLALTASLLIGARLVRWRLWRCRARPDIVALGLGYAWLALGLAGIGLAMMRGGGLSHWLHLVVIGALGTLSTSVMLRIHFQTRRKPPPGGPVVYLIAVLLALATVFRWLAGFPALDTARLLYPAAGAWSLAYLITAVFLLRRC